MSASLDKWWREAFERLLDAEQYGGVEPSSLAARWMALDRHVYPTDPRGSWSLGFKLPEKIAHFLDDADIRSKDERYAQSQWAHAREWLNG